MRTKISIVIPYLKLNNELLLWTQIRESADELHGLKEFPGGKVEPGESELGAACREVLEEVGVNIELRHLEFFKKYEFGSKIELGVYLYEDREGKFSQSGFSEISYLVSAHKELPPNNLQILLDLNFAKNTQ